MEAGVEDEDAAAAAGAARIRAEAARLPAREPGFVRQICSALEADDWGVGSGHRVIMVQGGTGSGKSSQIPQILLDNLGGPVLCTQPRRLAAASIAQRVAQERGCRLGSEVGYHIGSRRVARDTTRLLFATCGITLEMLRTSGPAALREFAFIVLDEVHERSSESDLVLACIHQYMKRELRNLRLVLMSATFDYERYKAYFADVGEGEAVPRIPVPQRQTLANSVLGHLIGRPAERYLSDAINRLEGIVSEGQHSSFVQLQRKMSKRKMPDEITGLRSGHVLTSAIHSLVCSLILSIELSDAVVRRPDPSGTGEIISADRTTLVFLPTYRSLEDLHQQLEIAQHRHGRSLQISVLHSSVDLDECLRSIAAESRGDAVHKVILASNIAESSLTIPGVSTVIDYCRCNQIHWDVGRAVANAKTVWASKSQCDQRCGRTGRTCQGTVYRLLPDRTVYDRTLPTWEPPELTLSSLHEEMLLLASSKNRAMQNVSTLLNSTLNPPEPDVIEAARQYLVNLGAIRLKSRRGTVVSEEATEYGRAVASLPLSLDGARLALRGMAEGQMRTSVLLGALCSTTPAPVAKPFGRQAQWHENLRMYGGEQLNVIDRTAVLMAQLTAYEWWQCKFVDVARLQRIGLRVSSAGMVVEIEAPTESDQTCSICTFPIAAEPQEAASEPEPESQDFVGESTDASYAVLPCGHRFHCRCIAMWIVEQPSCPNCRSRVPDSYLARLGQDGADGSSTIVGTTAALEEAEVAWCSEHALVRTALRAVQETAIATATALQALDLDLIFDDRNLKPEAWRANGLSAANSHPRYIQNLSGLMLNSSQAGGEATKLTTLVNDVLKDSANRVMEQGTLPPPPGLADSVRDTRKLCSFHFAGGCTRSDCRFRHALQPGEAPPLCKFFNTPQGCRFGDSCRMPHGDAAAAADTAREALSSVAAEQRLANQIGAGAIPDGSIPTAASSDGYKRRLANKVAVLLGEGDFSFAAAVAGTPKLLVATSLDSRQDVVSKYGSMAADHFFSVLSNPSHFIYHGIDATSLHEDPELHGLIRDRTDVLCWMFPFTGVEGDNQGNALLIRGWFSSIARVLHYKPGAARYGLPDARRLEQFEVHVALCGDQFSRWRVEASARDAFLTLCAIEPFDPKEFEGEYRPLRNDIDEPFALQKPLVYIFRFHASPLLPRA